MKKKLAVAAVLGLALVVLGGIVGLTHQPPTPGSDRGATAAPVDRLEQRIATAQDRLRRVPGDWLTWAGLGMAYLEHARITTDPGTLATVLWHDGRADEIALEGDREAFRRFLDLFRKT